MAAPRNRFCAHDRGPRLHPGADECRNCIAECRALHMVGIAPETLVPPTTVGRIGARVAEAAERWHRGLDDSGIGQAGREGIGVELRIMPRPRKSETRLVGKAGVGTCRCRWVRSQEKKKR